MFHVTKHTAILAAAAVLTAYSAFAEARVAVRFYGLAVPCFDDLQSDDDCTGSDATSHHPANRTSHAEARIGPNRR